MESQVSSSDNLKLFERTCTTENLVIVLSLWWLEKPFMDKKITYNSIYNVKVWFQYTNEAT